MVQILSVLTPGGLFMIPVRAAGCVHMQSHVLTSSRFARQLLHSVGFADVQCLAHVTSLPGFPQSLPGRAHMCFTSAACKRVNWVDALPMQVCD